MHRGRRRSQGISGCAWPYQSSPMHEQQWGKWLELCICSAASHRAAQLQLHQVTCWLENAQV